MSLDPRQLSDNLWSSYQSLIDTGMSKRQQWIQTWADNYDNYARNGTGSIMTTATSDKSILVTYLNNLPSNWDNGNYMLPVNWLAKMFVDYWGTVQLNPNPASNCVSITNNNSSDYLSQFEQAIIDSYRTTYESDHYYHFFVRNHNVVKQITWFGLDDDGHTLTSNIT